MSKPEFSESILSGSGNIMCGMILYTLCQNRKFQNFRILELSEFILRDEPGISIRIPIQTAGVDGQYGLAVHFKIAGDYINFRSDKKVIHCTSNDLICQLVLAPHSVNSLIL